MRARRLEVCGAGMGERAGEGGFFFPVLPRYPWYTSEWNCSEIVS